MGLLTMSAERQAQVNEESLAHLRSLGVDDPRVGEGGSFVVGGYKPPQLLERSVTETTPAWRQVLNARVARRVADASGLRASGGLPCLGFLPCSLRKDCVKTVTTYQDPKILGEGYPDVVQDATIHLNPLNAYIEGTARHSFWNEGKDGTKTDTTTRKCTGAPASEQHTAPVAGSATVDAAHPTSLVVTKVKQPLDKYQAAFSQMVPGASTSGSVSVRKGGVLDTLWSIIHIWTTGTCNFDIDIDQSLTFNWLGKSQVKSYHLHYNVNMPVKAVHYAW